MGVEDIQKVNKLAQELLNQRIVSSRDEAVKRAEEMLNKNSAVPTVQTKESGNRQNVAAMGGGDAESLRNVLDRTKDYFERQLAAYKTALMGLEKEMHNLKQEIEILKSRSMSAPRQQSDSSGHAQAPRGEQPSQRGAGQASSHPRTGSSKSDDVAIEKMFYYGNKR